MASPWLMLLGFRALPFPPSLALHWWAVLAVGPTLSQEGDCSLKDLPPVLLPASSPFPDVKPALWSEDSLHVPLLPPVHPSPCYPNKSLAHHSPSWHLLLRELKLMHSLCHFTGNCPVPEIRGSGAPLSEPASNPQAWTLRLSPLGQIFCSSLLILWPAFFPSLVSTSWSIWLG